MNTKPESREERRTPFGRGFYAGATDYGRGIKALRIPGRKTTSTIQWSEGWKRGWAWAAHEALANQTAKEDMAKTAEAASLTARPLWRRILDRVLAGFRKATP